MRIGIVGNGVVGHATARCYMENHEVRVHDILPDRSTHSFNDVVHCDVVFVCLPTPQIGDSGTCDLSAVEAFCAEVRGYPYPIVFKSTFPVGTTRYLQQEYGLRNVVHSPEFLTERRAVTDAQLPARNVIGAATGDRIWDPPENNCARRLYELYSDRFRGVPVLGMTFEESEFVKLATNSFFATKVTFFNDMHDLCNTLGLGWNTVLNGVLSDGRISHAHVQVPGPDGEYGFGGKCLPKDVAVLAREARPNSLLHAVMSGNARRRTARK